MSDIRVNTISDAAGTGPVELTKQSAAKAFCRISGGGTIKISLNVSSLTDDGVGLVTFSFGSDMDSDSFTSVSDSINASRRAAQCRGSSASHVSTAIRNSTALVDGAGQSVVVHGDLA